MGLHSGAANFFNVSFSVRMLNRKRSIKFLTVCSKFFQGNFVPNAAVYSVRAVVNSGCRYDDVNFAVGGEDWDFWMCLAEVSFRSKLFLSWKLISFVLLNSMVIGGEQYRNHSTGTEETLLLSELLVGETCLSMDSQLSRLEFTRNTLLSSKLANSPTSRLVLRNNSNVSTGLLPLKLTSLASRRVSCLSFLGFTLEELMSVCLLSLSLSLPSTVRADVTRLSRRPSHDSTFRRKRIPSYRCLHSLPQPRWYRTTTSSPSVHSRCSHPSFFPSCSRHSSLPQIPRRNSRNRRSRLLKLSTHL